MNSEMYFGIIFVFLNHLKKSEKSKKHAFSNVVMQNFLKDSISMDLPGETGMKRNKSKKKDSKKNNHFILHKYDIHTYLRHTSIQA